MVIHLICDHCQQQHSDLMTSSDKITVNVNALGWSITANVMHRIPMLPQCLERVVHNKRAKLRVTASVNATAHVCAKSMFLLQRWDEHHAGTATFSLSFLYTAVIKSFLKRVCLHSNAPGMGCYQKIHTATETQVNPTKRTPSTLLWSILHTTPFLVYCILSSYSEMFEEIKRAICCKIKGFMRLPFR